jgi:hypothetical protein
MAKNTNFWLQFLSSKTEHARIEISIKTTECFAALSKRIALNPNLISLMLIIE